MRMNVGGQIVLIDDEDSSLVSQYKWRLINAKTDEKPRYYVISDKRLPSGKWQPVLMHRLLTGAPKGLQVDHINGDSLDNRKSNLRFATQSQNNANSRHQTNKSSRYRGVSWIKRRKRWRAFIQHEGRYIHLGHFEDEKQAA